MSFNEVDWNKIRKAIQRQLDQIERTRSLINRDEAYLEWCKTQLKKKGGLTSANVRNINSSAGGGFGRRLPTNYL